MQGFLNWLRSLFGRPESGQPPSVPTSPAPVAPTPRPDPVPSPTPEPVTPPSVRPSAPEPPPPVTPPVDSPRPVEGVNLDFGRLWNSHPNVSHNEMQPCRRPDNVPNFGNQCAIRMGSCLSQNNLLKNYDGVECWFGHRGQGHTLRARELATWLRNHASTFGRVEVRSNVRWQDYVNRTGIIYCQNFWGENNQGDHIDLWDGTGDFMGSGSFSWEGPAMASGGLDYIERSEEVWFWPVH